MHRYGGSWFASPFLTACPRVVNLTALQTAGVVFSVFTATGGVFHTARAALQTATNLCMIVVSSHESVRCGDRETADAVAVDTAGDVSSGPTMIGKLSSALFVSCAKGGKHRASPPDFFCLSFGSS